VESIWSAANLRVFGTLQGTKSKLMPENNERMRRRRMKLPLADSPKNGDFGTGGGHPADSPTLEAAEVGACRG
jgi:hypothetical protein